MVSTAPTCANCGATINGHPILVRVVDEHGTTEQPVCGLDCAAAMTNTAPGDPQD